MRNAIVKQNDGLIKIDKEAATQRIDPVDATLCAYKLAMYHFFETAGQSVDDWLDEE